MKRKPVVNESHKKCDHDTCNVLTTEEIVINFKCKQCNKKFKYYIDAGSSMNDIIIRYKKIVRG